MPFNPPPPGSNKMTPGAIAASVGCAVFIALTIWVVIVLIVSSGDLSLHGPHQKEFPPGYSDPRVTNPTDQPYVGK